MPVFEWNFKMAFPTLYAQAEKPLPKNLLISHFGLPVAEAELSSDGEAYTIVLPELCERLIRGLLILTPKFYPNRRSDPSNELHLYGLEIVPATDVPSADARVNTG
jgi:hypothetical protein